MVKYKLINERFLKFKNLRSLRNLRIVYGLNAMCVLRNIEGCQLSQSSQLEPEVRRWRWVKKSYQRICFN